MRDWISFFGGDLVGVTYRIDRPEPGPFGSPGPAISILVGVNVAPSRTHYSWSNVLFRPSFPPKPPLLCVVSPRPAAAARAD